MFKKKDNIVQWCSANCAEAVEYVQKEIAADWNNYRDHSVTTTCIFAKKTISKINLEAKQRQEFLGIGPMNKIVNDRKDCGILIGLAFGR